MAEYDVDNPGGEVAGNPAPQPALGEGVLPQPFAWLLTGVAENWKRLALHMLAVALGLTLIAVGVLAVAASNKTVQTVAAAAVLPP